MRPHPDDEGIEHEMNRELGGREQAEIDRRVKRALADERLAAIPDAIVEKAAEAIYRKQAAEYRGGDYIPPWVELLVRDPSAQPAYRADARQALGAVYANIQAEALEAAADDWRSGLWAAAPRRADRVQERIANGQFVGDWLRQRASRLRDGGAS